MKCSCERNPGSRGCSSLATFLWSQGVLQNWAHSSKHAACKGRRPWLSRYLMYKILMCFLERIAGQRGWEEGRTWFWGQTDGRMGQQSLNIWSLEVSLVSELILGEETTDSLLPITSELPSIPGGSDCCVPTLGARIQSQFPRYPSSLSRCHMAMASSCVQENFWYTCTFGPGHNFGLGMASWGTLLELHVYVYEGGAALKVLKEGKHSGRVQGTGLWW